MVKKLCYFHRYYFFRPAFSLGSINKVFYRFLYFLSAFLNFIRSKRYHWLSLRQKASNKKIPAGRLRRSFNARSDFYRLYFKFGFFDTGSVFFPAVFFLKLVFYPSSFFLFVHPKKTTCCRYFYDLFFLYDQNFCRWNSDRLSYSYLASFNDIFWLSFYGGS